MAILCASFQAEQQIRLAAEAVVAVREDAEKRRIAQAKALHKQQASEALAAQLPRLEQYSIMQVVICNTPY